MSALRKETERLNAAFMLPYEPYNHSSIIGGTPLTTIYKSWGAPDPFERSWRFNVFLNVAKELFLQRDVDEMEAVYELACAIAINKGYSDFLNDLSALYEKCQSLISFESPIAKNNRRICEEAKRGLDWAIKDVFIIEMLDYLAATNKYILLEDNMTTKRLCSFLKTIRQPDKKIVWSETSTKFGKLFQVLYDNGCFKNTTTKEYLAKRILEIFDVKKGKSKNQVGHNTMRNYLSGDSLEKVNSDIAPFPRIKKIVSKALRQS